jgi:hypothetical protein
MFTAVSLRIEELVLRIQFNSINVYYHNFHFTFDSDFNIKIRKIHVSLQDNINSINKNT